MKEQVFGIKYERLSFWRDYENKKKDWDDQEFGKWKMEKRSVHWDNGIWKMKCGIKNLRSKFSVKMTAYPDFPLLTNQRPGLFKTNIHTQHNTHTAKAACWCCSAPQKIF